MPISMPLSADDFVAAQQKQMKKALTMLNKGMPKNKKVAITKRNGKPWIKVTPLGECSASYRDQSNHCYAGEHEE